MSLKLKLWNVKPVRLGQMMGSIMRNQVIPSVRLNLWPVMTKYFQLLNTSSKSFRFSRLGHVFINKIWLCEGGPRCPDCLFQHPDWGLQYGILCCSNPWHQEWNEVRTSAISYIINSSFQWRTLLVWWGLNSLKMYNWWSKKNNIQPVFCWLDSFLEPLLVDILVANMDQRRLFKCLAYLGFQDGL